MGNKINVDISKLFIPHPMQLFIFGTYKENGDANLGLFSWLNFCWDGELAVMVCLDGEKLTKERIKKTNIFSANIVTKPLFPLVKDLERGDSRQLTDIALDKGSILNVPVLRDSPLNYELEVKRTIFLNGSDIFICKIRNVMAISENSCDALPYSLKEENPVIVSLDSYFELQPQNKIGEWM